MEPTKHPRTPRMSTRPPSRATAVSKCPVVVACQATQLRHPEGERGCQGERGQGSPPGDHALEVGDGRQVLPQPCVELTDLGLDIGRGRRRQGDEQQRLHLRVRWPYVHPAHVIPAGWLP